MVTRAQSKRLEKVELERGETNSRSVILWDDGDGDARRAAAAHIIIVSWLPPEDVGNE